MAAIYLDTSFFLAFFENQSARRGEAQKILRYERQEGSLIYTSMLTLNEFFHLYYDRYKHEEDLDDRISDMKKKVRGIATTVGFSDDVMLTAALLLSTWGEQHRQATGQHPRAKKFRWDAIHLASANQVSAARVYAWDGWENVPKSCIPQVGDIICPAVCPQLLLADELPTEP